MNNHQLNRILNLIEKTGDKFVVADKETDKVFVVMDMLDYEEMQGVYDEDPGEVEDWFEQNWPETMPDLDDFGAETDEPGAEVEEEEEKTEEIAKISQDLPYSGKTEEIDEKWEENSYFPHIIEEKTKEEGSADDPEFMAKAEDLAKKSEKDNFFTSLGDAIKDKTLAEVSEKEPVVEEINPMSHETPLEDSSDAESEDSTLEGEDADRFYLEPV